MRLMFAQLSRLRNFSHLLLESACPMCGRLSPDEICLGCQRQILDCQASRASSCWKPPLPIFAWGRYEGALKRAIATLKYDNQPQMAHLLGQWVGQTWLKSPHAQKRSLIVVPIPMHRDKQRQRGYNQADLLATAFCHVTRLPLHREGLIRVRATQAQFSLSAAERVQNLVNAFQVNPLWVKKAPTKAVLLLDDVYTTGATVMAAADALRRYQIHVYGLVAIARPTQFKKDEQ